MKKTFKLTIEYTKEENFNTTSRSLKNVLYGIGKLILFCLKNKEWF